MADIAASVLSRLKNKASEGGRSYQLCLQLFCQEEFLRRLEKSKYSENLVLKGGLFIYSIPLLTFKTTIVEKIDAILSLMDFLSRMKGYFDIYYLAHKFDFDGEVLTEALKKTFANRWHSFTFEQVIGFVGDTSMQKEWKAFVWKINTKTDDFSFVLKTIKTF